MTTGPTSGINFHKLISILASNLQIELLLNSGLSDKVALFVVVFIALSQPGKFFL